MANADIPINVTAHELELSVTNNFVLESLVLENTTVATQDLTGDIIKISAVINRNCARYTLTSNSIKVNCVDANQVSVYETNPNTTYCIKFSELVYDDVSKTGTGRLIIEDVTVNDDGTIVVDDYENIIATFETDENRKYKVDSEKAYPYNYDTQKLQGIVEEKQDKLTIDDSLSSTSTNPIQNKAVYDVLKTKQTKENWELIREFVVGDETTYDDNDVMFYDDNGKLKQIYIVADKNGNPFHLDDILIRIYLPQRSDTAENYGVVSNPVCAVAINSAGFPTNSNGYKANNSAGPVSPKNSYYQITQSKIRDGGFLYGLCTPFYLSSAGDGVSNLKIWNSSGKYFNEETLWGKIVKKNRINLVSFYIYGTNVVPFVDGTKVTIIGARKDED